MSVTDLLIRLLAPRGCVSGAQMVNIQELCRKDDGTYDYDMIDGYDEMG
jgi:serine/threonine-protein kinase ATR